ncbi:glycosyltransferase family 2 protein [Pedobacter hartonius]|uniref:Glycosyl transferase family 2 n=1 Tax=Pedobacter hartonius TaxID=425514 RepID=A0A1H4HDN1_9SPHI|nr:glycosyltransferase family A protein [Pedobacter hartonius]SEB19894.1 Glycosyl transferase family 2 [Pedobacter hartonius]
MKVKLTHPLVSCLCITDNRPSLLLKAIVNFDAQNYPNRELVISYPSTDIATKNLLNRLLETSDLNIIPVERNASDSIGKAKNLAIHHCEGDYICTWDDDDIYYTNRLAHQFNSLQGQGKYFQAGILSHILLYNANTQKAYSSFPSYWGGSLICRKDLIIRYPYSNTNIAEDTSLLKSLESIKLLQKIDDAPYLYIFVYHGKNALDHSYYHFFSSRSQQLDQETAQNIRIYYEQQIELVY